MRMLCGFSSSNAESQSKAQDDATSGRPVTDSDDQADPVILVWRGNEESCLTGFQLFNDFTPTADPGSRPVVGGR